MSLDRLWDDGTAPPVTADDRDAVAAVQALLIGHGYSGLPTVLSPECGVFGPHTTAAIDQFQTSQGLTPTGRADGSTVQTLVKLPALAPIISPAYVAFVLDLACAGLLPLATVTMQLEGGGYFGAVNWNTDRSGLSFGLVQWAQRPGRLHELLAAFDRTDPDRFTRVLGGGDDAVSAGLLAHTGQPGGGVDPATGVTTDSHYDLTAEPWRSRFLAAGRDPVFQGAQVVTALAAFQASAERILQTLPWVKSERGMAFMLDVTNQFGDAGATAVATAVASPGMTESDLLLAVERETVARVARQYGPESAEARSTSNRREIVRTTPWLSDGPAVNLI